VFFAPGETIKQFQVSGPIVAYDGDGGIVAFPCSGSATLHVLAPVPTVSLVPLSLVGGQGAIATAVVTLPAAMRGPFNVYMDSSDENVIQYFDVLGNLGPTDGLTLNPGDTVARFLFQAKAVSQSQQISLFAGWDGSVTNHGIGNVTISPGQPPPPQKPSFNVLIDPAQGATGPVSFTANDFTTPPFVAKLGQPIFVTVSPAGGGAALSLTVSQSNVQANPASQSAIFGTPTRLFKDNVFVHFSPSKDSFFEDVVFGVHTGHSQVDLEFTYNGNTYHVHVPFDVFTCAGDRPNCKPTLGAGTDAYDDLIMQMADRNGVPPQLIKAQVADESGFHADAYRYEPLSFDFKYNRKGLNSIYAPLASWLLAQSSDCQTATVPNGSSIASLADANVTSRQIYGVMTAQSGTPLCRVTALPTQLPPVAGISSAQNLLSMENILYTNDDCLYKSQCSYWAAKNADFFDKFADYQWDHPPFSAQTVVASSYGLHQLMYETAVHMGYKANRIGLAPSGLFDPSTSLDLGAEYLARKYQSNSALSQGTDFPDFDTFLFQYGPALRDYNGPPAQTFSDIFQTCGPSTTYKADSQNPSSFDYPGVILNNTQAYTPGEIQ
jgi:hypothetical protein